MHETEIKVICNTGNYESTTYSVRYSDELAAIQHMISLLGRHYQNRGAPVSLESIAKRHGLKLRERGDLGLGEDLI